MYIGKDSLSMAARVGDETVKAPGSLVISTYAPCEDIMKTVTPDLKCPDGRGMTKRKDLHTHRLCFDNFVYTLSLII